MTIPDTHLPSHRLRRHTASRTSPFFGTLSAYEQHVHRHAVDPAQYTDEETPLRVHSLGGGLGGEMDTQTRRRIV